MVKGVNTATITITALFLLPVIVGVALNQAEPNMSTGMGVAYLALMGPILGGIATALLTLMSWRKIIDSPNYWIVAVSFAASAALFLLANSGALSRLQ